jgi:hypothetical protein
MTSTTISDRRRPQTKEKTEGRDLNHHNKKWMSWYCQWALQQQSKMALQVSLWSLSPHQYISILTAHKTVVLLNMCCLSALDWNLLHILFLLKRCHMNQEKNTLVGRSAILFHRCLHHYGSNIPKRSVCIRSSSFQQTESRQHFLLLFHIASSDPSHFITLLHMLTMNWTNSEHLLSGCYLW